jgi:hypothetical protein
VWVVLSVSVLATMSANCQEFDIMGGLPCC